MRQVSPIEEHSPLIKPSGRKLLEWMTVHPYAPKFNFECGDHLCMEDWAWLVGYQCLLQEDWKWPEAGPPEWVAEFTAHALAQVPHYRRYGVSDFDSTPPLDKDILRLEPTSLVPDDQELDKMVVYDTSGTTGTKMWVPSAPIVSASYLPLLRRGLSLHGIQLEGGPDQVAILQLGLQTSTLTYPMVSSFLGQAGFAKLNLNPNEWKEPGHRAKYIDACKPQIINGNPLSFLELTRLGIEHRPKAMVSSAMTLLPATRRYLEDFFGCPVFDMYSMTECMAIGLRREESEGHRILSHDLYVEVLDPQGRPLPHGQRGEVALTGGRNPFLKLLRYRTRDHARIEVRDGVPFLMNLEGRAPVEFQNSQGDRFNNIDVTHALAGLALVQFSLHQNTDRSLRLTYRGDGVPEESIHQSLGPLFGQLPLEVEHVSHNTPDDREKWIQYTTDIPQV
jgi:phenylacetate-CoA ligase